MRRTRSAYEMQTQPLRKELPHLRSLSFRTQPLHFMNSPYKRSKGFKAYQREIDPTFCRNQKVRANAKAYPHSRVYPPLRGASRFPYPLGDLYSNSLLDRNLFFLRRGMRIFLGFSFGFVPRRIIAIPRQNRLIRQTMS